MAVDLLVFGPHPDDLEIGLGGTIALHAARGLSVGLCDLTAGEMGSNGTVEGRLAESEAARQELGAVWRENLRALDCHVSQFGRASGAAAATRLNTPLFRQLVESRDAQFGALAGVTWAEGVVVREPILRSSLLKTL